MSVYTEPNEPLTVVVRTDRAWYRFGQNGSPTFTHSDSRERREAAIVAVLLRAALRDVEDDTP